MSTGERTGWRDQEISARHRLWGAACAATDLDLLLVEYSLGQPAALVEYKRHNVGKPDLRHATYQALARLADGADIPFVVALYWPEGGLWAFQVYPVNPSACEMYGDGQMLTERAFVDSLYKARQRVVDRDVLSRLNTGLPLRELELAWEER